MNEKYNFKYNYKKIFYNIKRKILDFRDFMEKHNLRNATMNEGELERVYNCHIYPRDCKILSERGFVNLDKGSQGCTHWTCFYIEDNRSLYFD